MIAWLPLLQTLTWAAFAVLALLFLGGPLRRLAVVATRRVRAGEIDVGTEDGWAAELDRLQALPYVGPAEPPSDGEPAGHRPSWTEIDEPDCGDPRRVLLVHAVAPHPRRAGQYLLFVLLAGDRRAERRLPADLGDVARAQFFLGRPWRDRIFDVRGPGATGLIGLRTTATGPTLCRCRLHFRDGHTAVVSRYLDFEMATAFRRSEPSD